MSSSPSNRLYVGNLAWSTTNDSLKAAFSSYGNVVEAKVMTDRETGRSRGFGFVTFSSEQEAKVAAERMNGQEVDQRQVRVDLAQNPTERTGFSGRGRPQY